MPGMIPLIKEKCPNLPIIYRSHIEIRSDLVHQPGSPQEEVWQYLWNNIKLADLFISACHATNHVCKEAESWHLCRSSGQQVRSG